MNKREYMQLRLEFQEATIVDEVSAVTAIVRPILTGILHSLKREVVNEAGGHDQVKLFMLPRLRRPGDGDIGICFEYAVHDAIRDKNPLILERIRDAMKLCNLHGHDIGSILFGAEKTGALSLIDTASSLLTDDSALLYGSRGRPVKLRAHIRAIAAAFRKPVYRSLLPQSISGLWKADLFTGNPDTDRWVGTTLKINRHQLEGARGLRLGIVPASEGEKDTLVKDEAKNLVICPLPYDQSFMQAFYEAWEVIVHFLHSDAKLPSEVNLPRPASRQVARYLEDRRAFAVQDVIEALAPLSQRNLLRTREQRADVVETRDTPTETTSTVLAPIPSEHK